jgi:hypothetical protein
MDRILPAESSNSRVTLPSSEEGVIEESIFIAGAAVREA